VFVETWSETDLQTGPVPLWHQLADRLRTAVEKGEFIQGDALPSETALIRRFGVSRTTARSALDHLENEHLISRKSGRGSIVLPPRVDQPLNLLASFAEDMRARGLTPSYRTRSVCRERASAEVAAGLRIDRRTRVVLVERLLIADQQPMAVSRSWLSPDVLAGHDLPTVSEMDNGSLYVWLERVCGARIARGQQFIEATTADSQLADLLGLVSGAPLLVARRSASVAGGTPVEYVVTHYVADRYRFCVDLVRP